jgi:hypothetical protein
MDEARAVALQQLLDALGIGRAYDEAGVVMPFDPQEYFRIAVGVGVGIILPRQRKNDSRVILPEGWELIGAVAASNLDAGREPGPGPRSDRD